MSDALDLFNSLPKAEAERQLYSSFANWAWAQEVASDRPYKDIDQLLDVAEGAWVKLKPGDWLGAFAAHPRIGESGGHAPTTSEREQTGVRQASSGTLAVLAEENRKYEARFGHVFLIAARGRSADDILYALRQRMSNDPATELEVAAKEQRKITRLRLLELLEP